MNRFQKNLAVQPVVIRLLAVCVGLVLSVVAFGFGLVDASPAKAAEEAETVKQSEPEEKAEEKARVIIDGGQVVDSIAKALRAAGLEGTGVGVTWDRGTVRLTGSVVDSDWKASVTNVVTEIEGVET
ncbi:MAG: hypothetical protein CMJ68_14985, partial [Planctomycetaceae bacterium]|nr:hypothetical protein [Planctomycetaceae bacterium]